MHINFQVPFVENIKMVTVQVFSVTFINFFCLYFGDPTNRALLTHCYRPLVYERNHNFALLWSAALEALQIFKGPDVVGGGECWEMKTRAHLYHWNDFETVFVS